MPSKLESIGQFLHSGGIFMVLILLCSIVALSVAIWKALALRAKHTAPADLTEILATGAAGNAAAAASASPSALGRVAHYAATGEFRSREDAQEAVAASAREEILQLESGIPTLEVVITIAPLLGLLGTASGLVTVFSGLGGAVDGAAADPTTIARGISEALGTTIAGLAVAVPAVVAHSYFARKIERLAARMEVLLGRLVSGRFN